MGRSYSGSSVTYTTIFGIPIPAVSDKAQRFNGSSFGSERTMVHGRLAHSATLLGSGKVLLAGGAGGSNPLDPTAISSAEVFDPSTLAFHPVGNMTTTRSTHASVLLADATVGILGGAGFSSETSLDTAEVYQPE